MYHFLILQNYILYFWDKINYSSYAFGHIAVKKEMWILSFRLQKLYVKLPFHRIMSKLSLVRIPPRPKFHKNYFQGSLSFQIILFRLLLGLYINKWYIDWTENSILMSTHLLTYCKIVRNYTNLHQHFLLQNGQWFTL